jgi:hypothetical protein
MRCPNSCRASCRCTPATRRWTRTDRRPPAGCLDYVAAVRRRWAGCWPISTCRWPRPRRSSPNRRGGRRVDQPAANPVLFHRLQDYSVRTSWKQELKARLARSSTARFARSSSASRHPRSAARPRLRRCTCTPATATCTPTSRSTPTTTRCCRRPRGRGPHHALARAWTA